MLRVRSRWWLSATGIAVVLAVALDVAYVAASLAHNAVRFDSAYNLSVPRNLAAGLGYASDGLIARSGSVVAFPETTQATLFDPVITTGPVVLGPLAVGFLGGSDGLWLARVLMCVWFVGLLVALGLVGRRLAGRWGMVLGLLVPLVFDPAMRVAAELRGPTDVIGEIPVAALLALAVWWVPRRPHVAALLVGVAVTIKLLAFLAAPAVVLAGAVVVGRPTVRRVLVRLVSTSVAVCAPLLCWQLTILWSLGGDGFRSNLRGQVGMFRAGGSGVEGGAQAAERLRLLGDAWVFPTVVSLGAVLVVVLVLVAGAVAARSRPADWVRRLPERPAAVTTAAATGAVVVWLAWFVFRSSENYPRYAYVPMVLGGTVLLCLLVQALTELGRRVPAPGVALVAVPLLGLAAWQTASSLEAAARPPAESLGDQRTAARVLQTASPDDTFGYVGAAAGPAALSLVADMSAVPALAAPDRPLFVPGGYPDLVATYCESPLLYESTSTVLCTPRR